MEIVPIDEEYIYDHNVIISQSDADGIITYVNRTFCEISLYNPDELIGYPHKKLRHPDMPKKLFKDMWDTIKTGKVWHGLVKNLRKDGLYYWVDTEILPIKNENDEITGYIEAKKPASRNDIEESQELYAKMLQEEQENEETK